MDLLQDNPDLDILAVATPDHLHTPVILAGLERRAHILTEKPMCLEITDLSRWNNSAIWLSESQAVSPVN